MSSGRDAVSGFGGGDSLVVMLAVAVADVVGERVAEGVPGSRRCRRRIG